MNVQYRRQIKQKLIIKQKNKCAYCWCTFDLNDKYKTPTLDHIIPKVKVWDKTDFVICCHKCNLCKWSIDLDLFLDWYICANYKLWYNLPSENRPLKVRWPLRWYHKKFPKLFNRNKKHYKITYYLY